MPDPTRTAIGTWSGGRFMRFGEPLDDERMLALLRPDDADPHRHDRRRVRRRRGRRAARPGARGRRREDYCLVGAVGHDFYEGEREGAKGFPRFTDPRLRGPEGYGDYLRMATERSLERLGAEAFDLLLLHNPDRTGYTHPAVWEGMAALREAGLTRRPRRRARPGERVHARPARLLRAPRRADRLGDDHPQPARALAGRARPRRRRAPRRAAHHPRGRLRRPVPRRRPPGPSVPAVGPPYVPPGRLGGARA